MAVINVNKTMVFKMWRELFNQLSANVGDLALLTTPEPDLVSAINNIDAEIAANNKKLIVLAMCLS